MTEQEAKNQPRSSESATEASELQQSASSQPAADLRRSERRAVVSALVWAPPMIVATATINARASQASCDPNCSPNCLPNNPPPCGPQGG